MTDPVLYVSDKHNAAARAMEEKLRAAPPESGILFISVVANPSANGIPKIVDVYLGIDRSMERETGIALIQHYLAEEMRRGTYEIRAAVYRGVVGAGARSGHGGAGRPPA